MTRIRWLVLVITLGIMSLWGVRAQAAALDVRLTTNPPVQAILPDETFATTTLDVRDENGDPLNGLVWIHLRTPQAPRLLGTDFPYVEETLLLDIPAQARDGRIELGLVYPIRGTYTFDIEAPMPDGGVRTARATLTIRENPAEVRNFIALLGVLFGIGLLAGFVIASNSRPVVLGLVLLLLMVMFPASVGAHGGAEHQASGGSAPGDTSWVLEGATWRVEGALDAPTAQVGMPLGMHFTATSLNGQPLPPASLTIEAIHAEDETPIYRFTIPLQEGRVPAAVHFFDGAPHDVRYTVVVGDEQATHTMRLPVEGVSPPLWTKWRALLILLTPLLAGMLFGYALARRTYRRRVVGAYA